MKNKKTNELKKHKQRIKKLLQLSVMNKINMQLL